MKSLEECREELKRIEPDRAKADSLKKVAKARLKALKQIKTDKETATIIVEQYYENIKELLTATLYMEGWKARSHECLIAYFREKHPEYAYEAGVIKELKTLRNRINYEGAFVKPSYLETNELEFRHIISILNIFI